MTLSSADKVFSKAVQDLFVNEQFLNSCSRDLSAHLREKPPKTMEKVADAAERFLTAQIGNYILHSNSHNKTPPRHFVRRNLPLRRVGKRARLSPGARNAFCVAGLAIEPTN